MIRRVLLGLAAVLALGVGVAVSQYNVANYFEPGGARLVIGGALDVVSGGGLDIESGGDLDIESGAALKVAGTDRTSALATSPAAVAAGYKIARGQATTASATDTIVSGLATVVSVVCSYNDDVADANILVSCTIGDQAGTPAAGSFILKTWKTDGTDPTPTAATSFTKKVNWIAVGT